MSKEITNDSNLGASLGKSIIKTIHILSIIGAAGGFLSMLVILLTRSKQNFTGAEVFYDKTLLMLFNTIVLNSVLLIIITVLLFGLFTEFHYRNYPFMIINSVLLFVIFWVGYLKVGFAISGMASISDAGFHMNEMADKYLSFWNQAVISLIIELILLTIVMLISAIKPFGKREKEASKYRNIILAVVTVLLMAGIGLFIKSEVTLFTVRGEHINDVDMSTIADGEYEGSVLYGKNDVSVKVTVENHQIVNIEDPDPGNSIFTKYASGVFKKIMTAQTPNVDAISGATTTSKAYMKAVEDALNN